MSGGLYGSLGCIVFSIGTPAARLAAHMSARRAWCQGPGDQQTRRKEQGLQQVCIPAAREATGLRATSHMVALRLGETLRILGFLILVLHKLSAHATARE